MRKNFKWYFCRLKAMTVCEIFDRIKFEVRKHKWKTFGLTRSNIEFELPKVKQPLIINNINEQSLEINIKGSEINKTLSNGINPDKKHWDQISKIAFRTFVPESEESRSKGAGGGDAND